MSEASGRSVTVDLSGGAATQLPRAADRWGPASSERTGPGASTGGRLAGWLAEHSTLSFVIRLSLAGNDLIILQMNYGIHLFQKRFRYVLIKGS